MKQEVTNFGRFYAAVRAMSIIGDRDEMKQSLVLQYTDGRTASLREMTREEYDRCCSDLERRTGRKEELRKERSATLKLMQQMGVDTTDWTRINALCCNPRIMGKEFARISIEEHRDLRMRLRAIRSKGGLSVSCSKPVAREVRSAPDRQKPGRVMVFDLSMMKGKA